MVILLLREHLANCKLIEVDKMRATSNYLLKEADGQLTDAFGGMLRCGALLGYYY